MGEVLQTACTFCLLSVVIPPLGGEFSVCVSSMGVSVRVHCGAFLFSIFSLSLYWDLLPFHYCCEYRWCYRVLLNCHLGWNHSPHGSPSRSCPVLLQPPWCSSLGTRRGNYHYLSTPTKPTLTPPSPPTHPARTPNPVPLFTGIPPALPPMPHLHPHP